MQNKEVKPVDLRVFDDRIKELDKLWEMEFISAEEYDKRFDAITKDCARHSQNSA